MGWSFGPPVELRVYNWRSAPNPKIFGYPNSQICGWKLRIESETRKPKTRRYPPQTRPAAILMREDWLDRFDPISSTWFRLGAKWGVHVLWKMKTKRITKSPKLKQFACGRLYFERFANWVQVCLVLLSCRGVPVAFIVITSAVAVLMTTDQAAWSPIQALNLPNPIIAAIPFCGVTYSQWLAFQLLDLFEQNWILSDVKPDWIQAGQRKTKFLLGRN